MGLRGVKRTVGEWFADLAATIYPRVCPVCGDALVRGEELLCLRCIAALPTLTPHDRQAVAWRVASTDTPIERVAAYLHYSRHGAYSQLIRSAKYNGLPRINRSLAAMCAPALKAEGFFDGIDVLTPVPLHPSKMRSRGYNQSEAICRGLSEATGIPVEHLLQARRHTSQTRLRMTERIANVAGVYHPSALASDYDGRHVMVVDDVLTTGSTLLGCCRALRTAAPSVRLSIFALAAAGR